MMFSELTAAELNLVSGGATQPVSIQPNSVTFGQGTSTVTTAMPNTSNYTSGGLYSSSTGVVYTSFGACVTNTANDIHQSNMNTLSYVAPIGTAIAAVDAVTQPGPTVDETKEAVATCQK